MHAVKQKKHCLMNESNLKSANRIYTAFLFSHSVLTIKSINILTILALKKSSLFSCISKLNFSFAITLIKNINYVI